MKVDGSRTSPDPTRIDKVPARSNTRGRTGLTLRHPKLHSQFAQALSFDAFLHVTRLSECVLRNRGTNTFHHARPRTLDTRPHHQDRRQH